MRVQQFQRSHFIFPNNARDPGQRKLEFLRFRCGREKKPTLCCPRPRRFCRQLNLDDWSTGRMRLQIKLQQLKKNSGIKQGDGKPKGALKELSLRASRTGEDARLSIIC